jgi:hypothetical protein
MASVDPILKQDLMLVKESFENGALKQNGAAVYLPFRPMISTTRQGHQAIRANVAKYPSVYIKGNSKKNSLLSKVQSECIPCAARLSYLKQLDISFDVDVTLNGYNKSSLNQLVTFFKQLKGQTPIERNLCDIAGALRGQCLPDLQRLLALLAMTLVDIRTFDLKKLKVSFLSFIFALLGKVVISLTTGLDKYTRLITDTIRCMSLQIQDQIDNLDPILSEEGRRNTAASFKKAWRNKENDKQWVAGYLANSIPPPEKVKGSSNLEAANSPRITPLYESRPVPPKNIDAQIDRAASVVATPFEQMQNAALKVQAASNPVSTAIGTPRIDQPLAILEGTLSLCISRVEANLDGAIQELLKLLKSNDDNMKGMNVLLEQMNAIIGMISMVQALVNSGGNNKYDPCGPERGRDFFHQLQIPGRRIYIVPPPIDSDRPLNDVDIIITNDPIQVDNPIVRDVLQQAGITVIQSEEPSSTSSVATAPVKTGQRQDNIRFTIDSEPMTINFFACMKKTLGQ